MDVCAWDWGAIATFTGTGGAIFISYQWRNQKGSDVLSKISEETYKQILGFQNLQTIINDRHSSYIQQNLDSNDKLTLTDNNAILRDFINESDSTYKKIIKNTDLISVYKGSNKIKESIGKLKKYYEEIHNLRYSLYDKSAQLNSITQDEKLLNIAKCSELTIAMNYQIDIIKKVLIKYVFHQK
jgi:subtilase family serine protease